MSFNNWLRNLRSVLTSGSGQRHHRRHGSLRAATHRLNVEALEDRCVPAQFAVTDLGYLFPTDLNNAGQVVGNSSLATDFGGASLVENGTQIYLGTLGGSYSHAEAINDLGQVVGYSAVTGNASRRAFLLTPQAGMWFRDSDLDGRNDFMIDLGTLNGSESSEATDINNAGQVVGSSGGVAFLWDAVNGMAGLGNGYATGINEIGQVTGDGGGAPFLWDAVNGMTLLDTGPDYFPTSVTAINDAGQIAGYQWYSADPLQNPLPRAVLWNGGFSYLGDPYYSISSSANDINNSGQVVGSITMDIGTIDTVYGSVAVLWDAGGGMQNLQDQLPRGTNAAMPSAQAINDRGAIVVNGSGAYGGPTAYLLTPISPGTPTVSIADAPAVTEGNAGTVAATFTVTLSAASTQTVTVAYATGNGTATAGSDYQTTSGTLTFAPGETSKTVTVLVNGDLISEPNETFVVNLSSPTNAVITGWQGEGTIVDDEPRISIGDVTVTEGNTGTASATFTVMLDAASTQTITVAYETGGGTATAGSDYQTTSGTLTFAPGETSKTVTVLVNGDRLVEPTETLSVNLSSSTNATIADGQGVGTITDDEPRISINNVTIKEGNGKKTTLFTFTVTLSAAYDQAVTMSFRTVNGTATTSDGDYVAKTGTLTFNAGETSKTITIVVNGDSKKEAHETYYLDLFGNSGNSLLTKNRGIGTILNDD